MKDKWAPRHDFHKVDLVFIVDCTGSMGAYIRNTQRQIRNIVEAITRTAFDTKLALIEYRDHPPQDQSFVTRVHPLTESVEDMKAWVDGMSARGGGDGPESVADGLEAATKLDYRADATKMCILIADAPPHGLDTLGDGFPQGCPVDLDPLIVCRKMAQMGVTLYCAGCEPAILAYKDFFMGLAHMTGGQYVPLAKADILSKVIINGTLQEVSAEKLMGCVSDWLSLEMRRKVKGNVSIDDLADSLHKYLHVTNNQCQQLQVDGKTPDPVTDRAKHYSAINTMAVARSLWQKTESVDRGCHDYGMDKDQSKSVVTLTAPTVVSKPQTKRLLRKALARNKIAVTHDEMTGEIIEEFGKATEML